MKLHPLSPPTLFLVRTNFGGTHVLTHVLKTSEEKNQCYLKHSGRDKRIWYLSPMRAAKVQASLRIRAVSPEPPLLAHTSSESRGTFKQKARSLAPLNGWACAIKVCHDGMLEDTNSLDAVPFNTLIIVRQDYSTFTRGVPTCRKSDPYWILSSICMNLFASILPF